MSPNARRYFGCFLPLVLAVFGCGTMLLAGNAARVAFEVRTVPDDSMEPLLERGMTVLLNNTAYWAEDPPVGDVVTVRTPDGWAFRRIAAVPGETIEVSDGTIEVNGEVRDPGYAPSGRGPDLAPLELGDDDYFVMADDRNAPDSRTWGPVPREAIFGRAIFLIAEGRQFLPVMVTPTPQTPGRATPSAH